jgi:hypothetical protein
MLAQSELLIQYLSLETLRPQRRNARRIARNKFGRLPLVFKHLDLRIRYWLMATGPSSQDTVDSRPPSF